MDVRRNVAEAGGHEVREPAPLAPVTIMHCMPSDAVTYTKTQRPIVPSSKST